MKKAALLLLAVLCTIFAGCSYKPDSIGIIGGADIPTAIFMVTMTIKRIIPFIAAACIAAVIAGIILYIIKKRK